MNMKLLTTIGLASLLGGCAGNVAPGGLDAGVCNQWDTDTGGFIDTTEFGVGFGETGVFNEWDTNDDLGIDQNEFGVGIGDNDDFGAFNDWDTDNSFGIDENEFGVGAFGVFDENDSGFIEANECEAGIGEFGA